MTSVAHARPAGGGGPHGDAHHAPMSFWRKYIFSTDHKIIGIQFLFVSLFFLLVGGLLAMQIRWQLGFPGKPLPVGVYANFLIPLKIGAHDMAFPRINMASFWLALLAGLIMTASFFVPNGPIRSGWTNYAPLAARPDLSGVTVGQMLWCISIVVLGLSSVMGSLNYITTVINHRAPGMTWFRMPLSVWALFITAILGVRALPVIQSAAIMLLFDNILGTHFFDP